jgi:hypothetical protein
MLCQLSDTNYGNRRAFVFYRNPLSFDINGETLTIPDEVFGLLLF